MKKFFGLLVATLFVSSSVFAAMTQLTPFTASVTFSGGAVTFTANYSKGNTTPITWATSGIVLGQETDQWKTAEGYFTLTKSVTDAKGKVYVYQDNKNGGSTYKAENGNKSGTGDDDYSFSGLVLGGSNGGNNNFRDLAFVVLANQGAPDWSKLTTESADYRYFTDKSTTGQYKFEKNAYNTIADVNGFNGIEDSANINTAYMYVGANFKNVYSGQSFGTDKIIFEYGVE